MVKQLLIITIVLMATLANSAQKNLDITEFFLHSKQSEKDPRFAYDRAVFELALRNTIDTYGPYKISSLEKKVNQKRIEQLTKNNVVENLFFKTSISQKKVNSYAYAAFPVDLGIVSYRIAFVPDNIKEQLKSVKHIDQLKDFLILQGLGWLDTDILRHHNFTVVEGTSYDGLFSMISKQRADLFTRGANEILGEWEAYKDLKNFNYDESIALFYPLPRFFFTHIENKVNARRIEEGLIISYNNGSLQALWNKHYAASIDFIKLDKRIIFKLINPYIQGIDIDYQQYFYQP